MSVKTSSLRRFTAAGLAALIAAGVALPGGTVFKSVKAEAAEINIKKLSNTVLGLNGISAPQISFTTDPWRGSYVWFGEYNGKPVKFRVLDPKSTDFGGTTMLLDCDTMVDTVDYQSSSYDEAGKKWNTCELRSWLNNDFLSSFKPEEQSAIFTSVKAEPADNDAHFTNITDHFLWTPLTGDKVFSLDALEAARPSYGYAHTTLKDLAKVKSNGEIYNWWLRSEGVELPAYPGVTVVGSVGEEGYYAVTSAWGNGNIGVSPAMNIDPSRVLFTTLVSGQAGKPGAEYKLTVMKDSTISPPAVSRNNNNISLLFTSALIHNDDYVSVLVTRGEYNSENAEILKYEKVDITGFLMSHFGSFALPNNYDPETDHVYLLKEEVTDYIHYSDIATKPREISIPNYKLTYDANGGTGEMKNRNVAPNQNTFDLDKCAFTYKDGYYFKNWNTAADGSGNSYDDCASITLEGNTTLYAQWALDPVTYISEDGTEKTLTEYTLVESSDTGVVWNGGFYVVKGDVTVSNEKTGVSIKKDSSLILCDGAKLTVTGSPNAIYTNSGVSLNIYGQSGQTGKLIGSTTVNRGMLVGGNLYVYGGDITLSGLNGIKADRGINVYRGTVNATAFGGSSNSTILANDDINIYGGIVTASTTGSAPGLETFHNIHLSWTEPTDRITACTIGIINGTLSEGVFFDKPFVIDNNGNLATWDNMAGKTLVPAYKVTFKDGDNVYAENGAPAETGKVTKPADPTKDMYTFIGWYNGDQKFDFANGTVDKDTTLTAHWTDITYTPVDEIPATCTAKGRKAYYIGSDGNNYIKQDDSYIRVENESELEIPALGHSFKYSASGAVITAKCQHAGCSLSGGKVTLKIEAPKLVKEGGTESAKATLSGLAKFNEATGLSISASRISYTGRNGTEYAKSATAPTKAGDYTASITVKGVTAKVDYTIALRGDVNNDGKVNMKDIVALQRHINDWPDEIYKAAADLNGDGNINMKDLVVLQRLVNGWAV